MSLKIGISANQGLTLFATLERLSDGRFWNNNATQTWDVAPSLANKKINLTEGSTENKGSYTASNAGSLGNAGQVRVRIHNDNDANDATVAMAVTYVHNGDEVLTGDIFAGMAVIDGKSLTAALQIIAAAAAGKVSGAGTGTEVFKGLDGATDRISATVDGSGNRTAISYP